MLQIDLVRGSAVAQPAMAALLTKLHALGFVERTPDPNDRRATRIDLTARGTDIATLGKRWLMEANDAGLDGFSTNDAQTLSHLVGRFLANLSRRDAIKHHK